MIKYFEIEYDDESEEITKTVYRNVYCDTEEGSIPFKNPSSYISADTADRAACKGRIGVAKEIIKIKTEPKRKTKTFVKFKENNCNDDGDPCEFAGRDETSCNECMLSAHFMKLITSKKNITITEVDEKGEHIE